MDHRSTFSTTTTTTRDFAECILFCVGAFVVAFEREEDFYCERRFALRQNVRRTEKNEDENAKKVDDDDENDLNKQKIVKWN